MYVGPMCKSSLAASCLLLALACANEEPTVPPSPSCTGISTPGIVVYIQHAITGEPLAAEARGAVQDGVYVDSLRPGAFSGFTRPPTMVSRKAAHERPGTYLVQVVHEGFEPYIKDGIRVEAGICHVWTQYLYADLVPLP